MSLIKLGWRQYFLRNILQRNMLIYAHQSTHTHTPKSHIHTHHVRHTTHTKHVHTLHSHHAFIYDRVYSCTYYDWKGHLAKFCFDRINASNNHLWVRNANIEGPKKIWIPKSTNLLHDIVVVTWYRYTPRLQDVGSCSILIAVA